MYAILAPVGVMNIATNAGSSYYTAILNEKMEKGPCVAMTLYGIIVLERVKSWRWRWAGNEFGRWGENGDSGKGGKIGSSIPECLSQKSFEYQKGHDVT